MQFAKGKKKKRQIALPIWCYEVASFLIPVLACVIFLAQKRVYPFGDQCILQKDMYDQYCPFFYDFARMLKSGSFSLYNWNMGLGADFVSTYSYYLSSPINFLLYFVPEKYVIEFMTYSIVLRIGISGFSFFHFLRYRFRLDAHSDSVEGIWLSVLFFSTAYALSGYVAAYYWQIMWMDCVALAPLIFLGLWKLQREKKPALYFVTLAIAIFSNYYIAMMICSFLVFYWLVLVLEEKRAGERIRFTLQFAIYSLLAGVAAAVLLLPTVIALGNSGSDVSAFPNVIEWYYSPLVALARGNAYSMVYSGSAYWPNIYAGILTLLLVLAFFFNQNISWKKKMPRLLMLLFFQISFMNNVLTYLWHGFRFPTWFPARQSFLYIFLLLTIAMEGYLQLQYVKKKYLFASFFVFAFLVLLSAFADGQEVTGWYSFRVTGLLIIVYAILFLLRMVVEADTKAFLRRVMLCIAFGEVLCSMKISSFQTTSRDEFVAKYEQTQQLLKLREEGDFYRINCPGISNRNDSSLMGYASLSVFNTVLNKGVADFYGEHFMCSFDKYYFSNGIMPILSAMLGARYTISSYEKVDSSFQTLVGNVGDYYLYENTYYLPIGFAVSETISEIATQTQMQMLQSRQTVLQQLNALPLNLTGKEVYSLFSNYSQKPVEIESAIEIQIEEAGAYYLYNEMQQIEKLKIIQTDGKTYTYDELSDISFIELGYLEKGDKLLLDNIEQAEAYFQLYKADQAVMGEVMSILGNHPFLLEGKPSSEFEGKITVGEGEMVLFSVPADKGWRIYVDDQEAEAASCFNAFLCVYPSPGEHTIRCCYEVPGLRVGAIISLLSICAAGILLIPFQRMQRKIEGGKTSC